MRRFPQAVSLAALLFVCGLYFPSATLARRPADTATTRIRMPQIPGAMPVGSDTCEACHADVAKSFHHAFHGQQGVQCEECHGPGSLHVQGAGDVGKIIAMKSRPAVEANAVCLSCHAQDEGTRHWEQGPHAANGVRCIDCHQVHAGAARAASEEELSFDAATHGAQNANLVSPETNDFVQAPRVTNEICLRCHQTQAAQMSMPYHHPLREGKMSCVDCHDPHGGPGGNNLRTANVNELCLSCHAQYRGPFAYQHPPVSENCLNCHTAHGSPNTNLLVLSLPALCLQCHSGHHNGANLPLSDRCTNCHSSIHGTDIATPSGGSRFIDKGPVGVPSEPPQPAQPASVAVTRETATAGAPASARPAANARSAWAGPAALLGARPEVSTADGALFGGSGTAAEADAGAAWSAWSWTPGSYRLIDGKGYLGRVGEYDSLEQSAGTDAASAVVSEQNHLTLVSRGALISGNDYFVRSQLTIGNWLGAGLDQRSLVEQQDHYVSHLALLSPADFGTPGAVTDSIPGNAEFAITRRLGSGYARVKMPKLPVRLSVRGNWQARAGQSQMAWLDENSTPAVYVDGVNTTCGALCHQDSHYQPVNYTTRNVSGGGDLELRRVLRLSLEHTFSSFSDRLVFPIATYTGPFTPENEGLSVIDPPPSGPAPTDFPAGNYYLDLPAPSQFSADTVQGSLTPDARLAWNGSVSYTRVRDTFTHNAQNWFDADQSVIWHPRTRLRLIADYHQQNLINDFTPYYTLYGNVSWHRHWEGLAADFELPASFDLEAGYRRGGITRSNAFLWPQVYSMDNTDLQTVIPSSTSDTASVALRYHEGGRWSARAGDAWTGTDHPGYLIVPGSNNRVFADVWITPHPWLAFSSDTSILVQNAFPSPLLPNTPTAAPGFGGDVAGLPSNFQRRDRFYTETVSATLHPAPPWTLGLGYSYQQNNLMAYAAFQNDASVNYVVDEPHIPWKQLTQAWWATSGYEAKRGGIELALTRNDSSSGFRPDLNPGDAASLGNAALIEQGMFDTGLFQSALGNLALSSTRISEVRVPQWIGESKAYYVFPHRIEGGTIFSTGSYRDQWKPNLNGDLRTFDVYVGRSW
jgi:predicted CXXCH cytochrome family protein